jgi:putative hydrolase of the HAD superfamily
LSKITAMFWDIGGVILTNGWDRHSRREAVEKYHLDWEEFQDRHDFSFPGFDSGHMTLNEYLDRTVFYRPRPFSREEFVEFMYAQSKEYAEVRAVLDQVTKSGKYLITSINNEPLELNQYRIEKFDLKRNFTAFFSSCYVRMALEVTQQIPGQCIFIDDRPLNLESPRRLGMNVIRHQNAEQLRAELQKFDVEV